jgi:glycerol-3-phosphate cytidylyltransferase
MFHIGHLNILKNAKAKCDYLIVGVSKDELVKEYKHKYPIVCYDHRREIVEAIKYVDKVVPQESLDKVIVWKKYNFDVVFVGSDWKNTKRWIETQKQLAKEGIDVIYLPYTKGISTTLLSEKAKK